MVAERGAKKILFIDDDEDLTHALCRVLSDAGYDIRCAQDGEEGLQMARQDPPDLILLDFMIPVKDGFSASQELRKTPYLQGVPIIGLTAYGKEVGEIYGWQQLEDAPQIDDCLEKPVEPNVLLERVARVVGDQ